MFHTETEASQEKKIIDIIKKLCQPLLPIPTQHPIRPPDKVFKVIIFDVYGTMFVSAAGEIGTDNPHMDEKSFRMALIDGGLNKKEILSIRNHISCIHEETRKSYDILHNQGLPYPEVDIIEIWKRVLKRLELPNIDEMGLRIIAASYECRVNPTWPMPELLNTLTALREMDVVLGILSNAQFYTLYLFRSLLGSEPSELGFSPDLCLWSYMEGEGKPSPKLFQVLNRRLKEKGFVACEVLYIGNDMLKDIAPAKKVGWATALFVGDKRSMRLRSDDDSCRSIEADYVIDDLGQLLATGHKYTI